MLECQTVTDEAQLAWEKSPRYRRMQFTDPTTPSNDFIQPHHTTAKKISKCHYANQDQTHPLANYLFHIGKVILPTCPSCQHDTDSIKHFILHCPAHHNTRENLWYCTGGRDIDIPCLLTNDKPLKALIRFIAETGRFNGMQPPPNPNKPQPDVSGQTEA